MASLCKGSCQSSRLTEGLLPPEGRRTPDCCGLIFRVLLVVDTCRKELVAICRRQIVRFRSVKPSRATVHRTVMQIEKTLWF